VHTCHRSGDKGTHWPEKIFRFRCDAALNGAHVQGHDPPLIPINLQGKESGKKQRKLIR